jgi:ABC-type multidrug transport system fused ATPase/permease subunit
MFKIFQTIDKDHKSNIPIFYLLLFLVTIFEFLSVFIMLPISQIFFKGKIEIDFFLTEYLNTLEFDHLVFLSLSALLIIYLIKNKLIIYFAWWKLIFVNKVEEKISFKLIRKYLSKDFNFFQNYTVGNFNNYLSVEVSNFSSSLLNLLQLISEIVIFISIAGLLIFHETSITIFLVLLILLIALTSGYFLKKFSIKYGKIGVKSLNNINDFSIQCFNSIIEIKIYSKLNFFSEIFKKYKIKNLIAKRNAAIIGEVPKPIFEFILILSFAILIYHLIDTNNFEKFPEIMTLFLAGSYRLIPAVSRCSSLFQNLKKNEYLINNIINDLKITENQNSNLKVKNVKFDKSIEIKKIDFSFLDDSGTENKILNNFSLSINKGEYIGIMGKSGCGKTTLINLILGFLKPSKGMILADNETEISINTDSWLKNLSYVPQNPVIIEDTIKSNIALSHDNIDQAKLDDCIEKACLKDDFLNFKTGLNTFLGTKGVTLSGGQKQRISIARAIYKNSNIIILDEPTSALDAETENKIMNNLFTLKNKTIIMVTHKANLLEKFDKIIKL